MTRPSLVLVCMLAACGGDDTETDPGYQITEDMLTFQTGEFEVPPGEVFECFYTGVITDRELAVRGAFGAQGRGGHHVTVYYTMIHKDAQHHPCIDSEMAQWRMIGGGGDEGEAQLSKLRLPDGMAIKVPAGAQIVLQAHYINLGERFTANDTAGLELVDPAGIRDHVNQFVVNDVSFTVPPHEPLESVSTCTVPRDLGLIRLLGHMHEFGTYYKLEQLGEDDTVATTLLEQEWDPVYTSAPPIEVYEPDAPLAMAAGTRLRQTCRWQNHGDEPLLFPREMCIAYGLYFPDVGEVFCAMD